MARDGQGVPGKGGRRRHTPPRYTEPHRPPALPVSSCTLHSIDCLFVMPRLTRHRLTRLFCCFVVSCLFLLEVISRAGPQASLHVGPQGSALPPRAFLATAVGRLGQPCSATPTFAPSSRHGRLLPLLPLLPLPRLRLLRLPLLPLLLLLLHRLLCRSRRRGFRHHPPLLPHTIGQGGRTRTRHPYGATQPTLRCRSLPRACSVPR